MVRLQKFLSEAGVASRREGEKLILAGRISVDGQVVRLLGTKIDPAKNEMALDGRPLKPLAKRFADVAAADDQCPHVATVSLGQEGARLILDFAGRKVARTFCGRT